MDIEFFEIYYCKNEFNEKINLLSSSCVQHSLLL